jgi:hypothetical protein
VVKAGRGVGEAESNKQNTLAYMGVATSMRVK